jgi:4-azaleucine resistance transporter AzlC
MNLRRFADPTRQASGFGDGAKAALPLCLVLVPFGASFGVLARANGFGVVAPIVMSMTTFTGASQFAVVWILGDGGGLGAAIVAAVLLAARYGPIGLSVAPVLRGPVLGRFAQSQLVIDESWAVASRGGGPVNRATLLGAGLALYVSWQFGTVLGVIGGDFLGDPEDLGLDAAFPALFLVLLVSQLKTRQAIAAAFGGAAIALALVPFTQAGVPIIAASLACLAGWWRR